MKRIGITPIQPAGELAGMKLEQLTALAAERGIDVSGCKTKAEYISVILEKCSRE